MTEQGPVARARALLLRFLHDHPVSLAFSLGVVLIGGIVVNAFGLTPFVAADPRITLGGWRLWTLLTAPLLPDAPLDAVLGILVGLTVLAYAESLLGTRRTLLVLLGGGTLATLIAMLLELAVAALPGLGSLSQTSVLNPMISLTVVAIAASFVAPVLWSRRIRIVFIALVVMLALYAGDPDSWYAVVALPVGAVFGRRFSRGQTRHGWLRSSIRETRAIVATLVAVIAAGPLAALASGGGRGPFAIVATMFAEYNQKLVDRCAVHPTHVCDDIGQAVLTRGLGPALLALVPLALSLVAAWGLRGGRRAAWALALIVNIVVAFFALLSVAIGTVYLGADPDAYVREGLLWGISAIGVPVAMAVTLLATRRAFQVAADRRAVVRSLSAIVAAYVLCAGAFVVAGVVESRVFSRDVSTGELIAQSIWRFLPRAFLLGLDPSSYPRRAGLALFMYQWVGPVFWAVVIVVLLLLFRRTRRSQVQDARHYRILLRWLGGSTLSWWGTWPGARHWYRDDGRAALAYRVESGVALALADPVCVPGEEEQSIHGFCDFAIRHGWTPAFYSAHDDLLPVFESMGWRTMPVGEETVLDPTELTLVGKTWEKVRHPTTRMEREGVTARWARWAELDPATVRQLQEISEEWVGERALPEMGFTLGSLDEARDPEVMLMLALDPGGRVLAFTSWLPVWREGAAHGWTLDLMRRRGDSPNGVMEFLIVRVAQQLAGDGIRVMSLSGAPLATKPGQERAGILAWLSTALEPLYGFGSLFRFKGKFHPRYRTLVLAYADPVQLPAIAASVARCYLPGASRAQNLALAQAILSGAR